jgi:TRAP-type C4-dicarboxylate transport system permease small subunit
MLRRLGQLELAACVILLAAITGLVFVAAVMRFFGHPLVWSVDLAQLLFIWLCFFGASRAMREKSHIGMEMLVKHLGYRRQLWLEMAMSALILAFLGVLAVEGWELTLMNRERVFGDSTLSYAWVTVAVPVGCVLLGVALLYNMASAWRRRNEGALVYSRTTADRELEPALEL